MINKTHYQPPQKDGWSGRTDGEDPSQWRWHQVVEPVDISGAHGFSFGSNICLLGFACDEGVRRNKGRVGAAGAPEVLRDVCAGLPVHFPQEKRLFDTGNIICAGTDLEAAQQVLAEAVYSILGREGVPLLFGGGHEIAYGHFNGIRKMYPGKKAGIVNFDAHFDLRRPVDNKASSGTGFYQIARDAGKERRALHFFVVGIQESGNTRSLFERAQALQIAYIPARDFHAFRLHEIKAQLQAFIEQVEIIYITIDMDVFASAYAPGVSAITAAGLTYDFLFYEVLRLLAGSRKVVSFDIAELNPLFDIDHRTAKLAAQLIFDWTGLITANSCL